MQDSRLGLVIDQGGHGSRAAVCDAQGNILALAHRPIQTYRPAPLFVELDPEALVGSIEEAIADCLQQLRYIQSKQLSYAALACQRSNVLCWSRKTGKALSPVISWQDRRAGEWLQRQHLPGDMVRDITGLVANPHYGASKIRWCLDQLPAVAEAAATGDLIYGPMASFLLYRLLDERPLYADAVNASRTLLWDWRSGDWSPYLLQQFHLDPDCLPQAVPSRFDFGTLRGPGYNLPMQWVMGDLAAALYAEGMPDESTVYITAGTGAFIQRPCGVMPCLSDGLLGGVVMQDKDGLHYSLEGTVNGAGSAYDWLEREHGIANWREILDGEPEPSELVFINSVSGLGSPYWVSDLPACFLGEDGDESGDRQKVFAVLESIVFLLYENYICLQDVGAPPERIKVGGGLAQSDGLCQRLASLCQVPVLRTEEGEATVKGAARLLSGRLAPETGGELFRPQVDSDLLLRYQRWHAALHGMLNRTAT